MTTKTAFSYSHTIGFLSNRYKGFQNPVDVAMVASIKEVAKAMGMTTVAEFVESEATMAQLGRIGIDFAQGFSVSAPKPLNTFTPL